MTLWLASLQLAAALAVGWVIGEAIASRTLDERGLRLPERALLAIVGFVAFCIALMVAHIVTGGAVFGISGIVPAIGAVVVAVGIRNKSWARAMPWLKLAGAAVILVALFVRPVIIGGSGVRTGDPPWHMGWSEQVLGGEAVPTGPAPEQLTRNAYPWGFHAVIATLVRLVPGTDPLIAHEALHLLIVLAIPLAAACLARRVDRRAGWAAAAAMALIGGFGWIQARDATLITSPRESRFGADLVVASPNSLYELFPPALPRELGLVLLGAFGVLLLLAGRRHRELAGATAGFAGLISVPMFVAAVVWLIAASVRSPRNLARAGIPALLVFALWAAPVAADYARYGGFVELNPNLGKEWALPTALASWGLLLGLVVLGVIVARRHFSLFAFTAATALLLMAAVLRREFDWDVGGVPTLLHQGRVWPVAHLLGAALGGIGLAWMYRKLATRSRAAAAAIAAGVLVVGAASPVLASRGLTNILRADRDGFLFDGAPVERESFVRRAAAMLDPADVVRVDGPSELAFLLFQFSGCRLAAYDDPSLAGNDLRIRYAELAAAWDAQETFPARFVVQRGRAEDALVTGPYRDSEWSLVPARSAAV
jgi:hypothetical protein